MDEKEIINEFASLQIAKREIEMKLEMLKKKIIGFSVDSGKETLFGSNKVCSVKGYDKIIWPADKSQLTEMIKKKGLYEQFSSLNYFKLSPRILKGEVDREIADMTKRERDYRISLRDKTELVVG
jgi:hypothetical protein